jgi:hypothetical protein
VRSILAQTRPVTSHTGVDADEHAYRTLLDKVLADEIVAAVNEVLATDFETLQRRFRRTLERTAVETERLSKLRSGDDDLSLRRARADRVHAVITFLQPVNKT